MEDILKERIQPYPDETILSRPFTVQETKSLSRHESPIPPSPPPLVPADNTAMPIPTPRILTPLPRIPTPPLPSASPPPEKPISPPPEKSISPAPEKPSTPSSEHPATPPPEQSIYPISEPPPPYIINYEKIRRGITHANINSLSNFCLDLLGAIEERTIPALEEAIQQVKDHDYIQPLKYECERALELLNRLMKIEHMK